MDDVPMTTPAASDRIAADVYSALIKQQNDYEAVRKASLEQRGVTVINITGILVSLLLGLVTFIKDVPGVATSRTPQWLVTVALGFFVVSATLGILTNWPLPHGRIADSDLQKLTDTALWSAPAAAADRRIADAFVAILSISRRSNDIKARALAAAMIAQVVATTCIALSASMAVVG